MWTRFEMKVEQDISLRPFNTFGVDAKAKWFARFSNVEELEELLAGHRERRTFVLGGGSNILLTRDFPGLVLKNEIRGTRLLHEDTDHVYVQAGAGENWHEFVTYCISKNWAGLENLSLIPGNVGASPMQNIGAYGVELQDYFWELDAFHLRDLKLYSFTTQDCGFAYRHSVFKTKYRDQFVILSVTFRLRKRPVFHTSYGSLREELEKMGIQELSIRGIADAVIRIRRSKLPDPAEIGNAGSFFKNPVVDAARYQKLKEKFPDIVGYEGLDGSVKLAAAWLIEHCGPDRSVSWKGYRTGDAGCHVRQPLVLVNYGTAKGKEIYELSERIRKSVRTKFGVDLEREVNIL